MVSDEKLSGFLLDWMNVQLGTNIRSLDDISDGGQIWELLQRAWPTDFQAKLPDDTSRDRNWAARYQNLKHLYKHLDPLLNRECDKYDLLVPTKPELRDVAQHSALKETTILLKMVFLAVYSSPVPELGDRTTDYVRTVPVETQMAFASLVIPPEGGAKREQSRAPDPIQEEESTTRTKATRNDDDIFLENSRLGEEVNRLYGRVQRAETEKAQTQTELTSAQKKLSEADEERKRLEGRCTEYRDRLARFTRGDEEAAGSKTLQSISADLQAQISSLEDQLRQSEEEKTGLRKSNDSLKQKASKYQQSQDEIDELKTTVQDLSRRANAAEKYRDKIKRFNDIETENTDLRRKINDLQEDINNTDMNAVSSSNFRRENEELRKLHEQIELHYQDEKQKNNNLIFEVQSLSRKMANIETENLKLQKELEALPQDGPLSSPSTQQATPRSAHERAVELAEELAAVKVGLDSSALSPDQAQARVKQLEGELAELNAKLEDSITEDELQHLLSVVRQNAQKSNLESEEEQFRMQKAFAGKIENGRIASQKLQQHAITQASVIAQLQAQVTKLSTSPPPADIPSDQSSATPADLAASRELRTNLQRELNLMSTAWYDLQSRLQSPNVSVARGRIGAASEPRSWIGKQRKLVHGVLLGK